MKFLATTTQALAVLLCLGIAPLGSSVARAQDVRVTPEVLTVVPIGLGAAVEAEVSQIRFGLGLMWVPPAYVELADEVGQAVGGYNDLTSALVRAATENALALQLRAGVRPFKDEQFYVDALYTLLALGGSFSTDDLAAASGQVEVSGTNDGWDLGSTVHQVGLEVGYRFLFDDVALRVALGWNFTVAADVDAQLVTAARFPGLTDTVEEIGAAYLESTYTSYVHIPLLTVAVGWDLYP
ncbi:MAG: hypothetical protein AAFU79_28045 [Myxococcota bacterium]